MEPEHDVHGIGDGIETAKSLHTIKSKVKTWIMEGIQDASDEFAVSLDGTGVVCKHFHVEDLARMKCSEYNQPHFIIDEESMVLLACSSSISPKSLPRLSRLRITTKADAMAGWIRHNVYVRHLLRISSFFSNHSQVI